MGACRPVVTTTRFAYLSIDDTITAIYGHQRQGAGTGTRGSRG